MSGARLLAMFSMLCACDPGKSHEDPAADTAAAEGEECVNQSSDEPLSHEEAVALKSAFVYQGVAEPQALVLMFHGGGGEMADHFERVDPERITREALARGMAVASLNSAAHLDPDAGSELQWHEGDYGDNPDLDEVEEMVRKLTSGAELGVVPEGTPLVLFGSSNGGSMASRVAQVPSLDVAATAIYISNAVEFHEDDPVLPPMVLIPGEQDPGLALTTNTTLADEIGDPQLALLHVNPPEPVSDALLTRISGVDCELAGTILADLIAGGFVDDDGTVLADPNADTSWRDLLSGAASDHELDIKDVLVEAYAGHAPSSDQNEVVFDFVESNL